MKILLLTTDPGGKDIRFDFLNFFDGSMSLKIHLKANFLCTYYSVWK